MRLSDLPDGDCHGVVLHWSAGRYPTWFPHYHLCVLGPPHDGEIINSFPIAKNLREIPPGDTDYAAHTRRRNSFRIGIGAMAMYGAASNNYGHFPPTKKQVEVICALAGLLVVKYDLDVQAEVRTHYEWAVDDAYFPNRWDWMKETPVLKRKTKWYAAQIRAGRL